MNTHIQIHHPKVQTQLPAHEHAARCRRTDDAKLPGIPHRAPKTLREPALPPGARKTVDVRYPNLRF